MVFSDPFYSIGFNAEIEKDAGSVSKYLYSFSSETCKEGKN